MGEQVILDGDPPIELVLNRSSRARRLSLRVSRLDGRVTLTLPRGASRRHALAFAEEKAGWIRRQLAGRPDEARPMPGAVLPYRGVETPIVTHTARAVRHTGAAIAVPAHDPDRTPARLAAFLKLQARDALAEASARHAAALGRAHGRITLRDTRSRWGSCSSKGDLMYSWRLIMAPAEVLDYVAAHEVAHLAEMNHSPAFWAVVGDLFPGYEAPRRWLHENAPRLHRYRFRD
ncbi:M48 family metallopeptidase [Sinisalibacter aestuarii]|uniref:Zinc metalloprotease n=1 Tax=Sinisalibacter aestuarii TaxID=2949426 RepID=A0ABQ5LM92_9RHOB|nr:SprT family zinc-dependent metalloprotease [Sinisalibacter aestuarii]GKY86144.1 zinc metalloprotease [Sinisalibacter aestuarii]